MLPEFTIYGERCSGTNYLEQLVLNNFNAEVTWRYGWKHFFGFQEKELALEDSSNTLFICIVRDPVKWINSFYRELHHLPLKFQKIPNENIKLDRFLNKEIWSTCNPDGDIANSREQMCDRNIYTGARYKNIFELRHTKIRYLLEDLPKKVKNHIFIRYEDLMCDFETTMNKIKDKGLQVKDATTFPLNTTQYKAHKNVKFDKNHYSDTIPRTFVINNPNLIKLYECQLGYL